MKRITLLMSFIFIALSAHSSVQEVRPHQVKEFSQNKYYGIAKLNEESITVVSSRNHSFKIWDESSLYIWITKKPNFFRRDKNRYLVLFNDITKEKVALALGKDDIKSETIQVETSQYKIFGRPTLWSEDLSKIVKQKQCTYRCGTLPKMKMCVNPSNGTSQQCGHTLDPVMCQGSQQVESTTTANFKKYNLEVSFSNGGIINFESIIERQIVTTDKDLESCK